MIDAARVVSIALAEVGYREKASNSGLDQPAANAGSGNWTKYARDLAAAGYYNGNKNGYAWCDIFVDWCVWQASGKDPARAQRIQCQTGPLGAVCPYSAQYYKDKGRYDRTPRVGDQVFFQQGGEIVHTGVVVEVTASTVTTVEGNSGDKVAKHTYSRSDSYIAGYGHPLYEDESISGVVPAPEATPADHVKEWQRWLGVDADGEVGPATNEASVRKLLLALLAMYPLQWGDVGDAVKVLQGHLYAAGYDPDGLDGEYGPGTKSAVRALQQAKGLAADGEAGADTFAAIYGWS